MSALSSPEPTFDPQLPFRRSEALADGLTDDDLRSGRYRRIFHGIYVVATVVVDSWMRAAAALRVMPPGSHISHHSAVALHGGVAPETLATHVSTVAGRLRTVRQGIQAHWSMTQASVIRLRGLPVSSPTQAFLELARLGVSLVDLVVAGDTLLKATGIERVAFVTAAESCHGRGGRLARRAARLVRDGVDSAMESRLRLLIVLAGLPEPVVNYIVRYADGEWAQRFDMAYPGLKLIVEYDGRHHMRDTAQWRRDLKRREQLEGEGWRFIVVTAEDIYQTPFQTLLRIQAALRERGATGVPRRMQNSWMLHFAH